MPKWEQEVRNHTEEDTIIYLIGTMSDLESQRQVTVEEAEEACSRSKFAGYFETSSKTGDNVESTFM